MSPEDIRKVSISDLSDRYGKLHELTRTLEAEKESLKAEFKRRGLAGVQPGTMFTVTISEAASTCLDVEAMRADPKLARHLSRYERQSSPICFSVRRMPASYSTQDASPPPVPASRRARRS